MFIDFVYPPVQALPTRPLATQHACTNLKLGKIDFPLSLGTTMAKDLVVRKLLPTRLTIGDFPGYQSVNLTKEHLDIMVRQDVSTWRAALASVKGIYLITDSATGKLYVGKADGEDGEQCAVGRLGMAFERLRIDHS
jgi:hypothetical protein